MSKAIDSHAAQATIRACWRQWRAVTGSGLAVGQRPTRAIIDPEALVLASLAMRHEEQRFRDLLLWWAQGNAHLLSVQRLQTVMELFPESALGGGVKWFAAMALDAGDARWKRLAAGASPGEPARAGKGPRKLQLLEPATLMLRMRAGFGVGAKADLMTFLMGASSALRRRDVWTTAHVVSEAIGYSRTSISRAASEMALARFIDVSADRPPLYSLEPDPWARVFRLWDPFEQGGGPVGQHQAARFDIPPWRFWAHQFGFLLAVVEWARESTANELAPVVHASRARDIGERFGRHLAWSGIEVPDGSIFPGERYLGPFDRMVTQVVEQMEEGL